MAYSALHIERALRLRLRGGATWLGAVARISMWFMAATVKDERKDLSLVKETTSDNSVSWKSCKHSEKSTAIVIKTVF